MPVYVYHCTNCGVQFDKLQSFSDQPLTRCPECGKKTLHKVYQPVGIVFKGSGFYATDHHSPSGQSSKKDDRDRKESGESKEPQIKAEKGSDKKDDGGGKEISAKPEKSSEAKESEN
jgi:putative FmdB family regulatory protein